MRATLALLTCLGTSACNVPGLGSLAPPVSAPEVCAELAGPVTALADALRTYPETPRLVGEAGVEVIVTADAGCAS